jgi:hypothetical protein
MILQSPNIQETSLRLIYLPSFDIIFVKVRDINAKHTYLLVFSILDAVVNGINKWFPHLTTVVLQSNNASCYQSAALLIMIQYLIYPHSIRV